MTRRDSTTQAGRPARSLDDLLRALVDGPISDADYAALGDLLRGDAAAQRLYIDYLLLDHGLSVDAQRLETDTASDAPAMRIAPAISKIENRKSKIAYAFAAALLLAGVAAAVFILSANQQSEIKNQKSLSPIATLIWSDAPIESDEPILSGQSFGPQTIRTRSGETEFRLTSGAGIQIRGRSQLTLHDAMSATLTRGSATFDCPPTAVGYTVHLPDGSRVIDLGTAFTLTVHDPLRAVVSVSDGVVRLWLPDGTEREVRAGDTLELIAGRFASPIEATISASSPPHTFTAASDDLLQTAVVVRELGPPASPGGVFGGQDAEALTNGPAVWSPDPAKTDESYSSDHGGSITWRLDTDAAPGGYDIESIASLTGSRPSRVGQVYTVEVSFVGDDAFHRLVRVDHPDNLGRGAGFVERRCDVRRRDGDPLAAGVDAIRFTFHDDRGFGQSVYREIDVIGRPATIQPSDPSNLSDEPADRREGSSDADVPLGRN